MDRRSFLQSSLAAMAAASLPNLFAHANAASKDKPNIILIMADDLGYECIGANGGTSYRTPILDGLAANGMRFDRCYSQPLCTPTRVQLMTGMYNVRNYTRFGSMEPKSTTFAHMLKQAGYATGIVGKWQLGKDVDLPKKFGFDEHILWQHTRRPSRYRNPGLEINGKQVDYTNGEFGPDLICDHGKDFVSRHAKHPFFLYWPMILPHSPFVPTPDSASWGKKPGEGAGQQQNFADMVAYMDKLIGKMTDHLDKLGLRKNTLLLFLGDNGTGQAIQTKMGDKTIKGGKGNGDLTGMHVPLIANWPGVIPAGKVCSDVVDTTDFVPTLCDATGAAPPEKLTIDGQSFLPQLRGDKGKPREWSYCWYARDGGAKASSEFAFNRQYLLQKSGELLRIADDGVSTTAIAANAEAADITAARKSLQAALDRYKDARPPEVAAQTGRGATNEE